MKKDKKSPKVALRESLHSVSEEISKKKHLTQAERTAKFEIEKRTELAFIFSFAIARLRANGMSKADVLYATSAVLKMELGI